MDIAAVDEVLSTTRAVRRRLDLTRPVEREVILECLRLAVQAPTASNGQNWRWLVVTDPDKRAAIADIYRSCGEAYLAHAARTTEDPQTRRVYESAHALSQTLAQVPVHVIPCIEARLANPLGRAAQRGRRSSQPPGVSCSRCGPRPWIGVDHAASHEGRRGRRTAGHSGQRDAGCAAAGRLHDGDRFQTGSEAARRTITSWNTWDAR